MKPSNLATHEVLGIREKSTHGISKIIFPMVSTGLANYP